MSHLAQYLVAAAAEATTSGVDYVRALSIGALVAGAVAVLLLSEDQDRGDGTYVAAPLALGLAAYQLAVAVQL